MTKAAPFVLDTCALTWAMRDAYPIDIAPGFWEKLEQAVNAGIVISNEMVFREIKQQDDSLYAWCNQLPQLFCDIDQAILDKAAELVGNYPKMINPLGEKDGADPFLIAQAILCNGVVVTQEKIAGPTANKIKIPDVCCLIGLKCVTTLLMMKDLGWKLV